MDKRRKKWYLISIHAPRTGSDLHSTRTPSRRGHFNPRSPHGERPHAPRRRPTTTNFNPRSPHGERPPTPTRTTRCLISIHAPRTGSDTTAQHPDSPARGFQSTLPARGATICARRRARKSSNFNPRSPHGERQRKVTILSIRIIGFAQKVYHKTVLLRISLAENAVILPKRPQNPVRTSLQKAGGLRFARAIRAARPYSISSPSGA